MTLDDFHYTIGQKIMYCQVIEHDLKRIYAAMHIGDFYDNLTKIEKLSYEETAKILGQTLQNTKSLIHRGKKQLRKILLKKF